MGNEKNHGGKRERAGRPTKAEEITLIKAIDRHVNTETLLFKLLNIINNKDGKDADKIKAISLLLNYRWGLPKQSIKMENKFIEPITFIDATDDNDTYIATPD